MMVRSPSTSYARGLLAEGVACAYLWLKGYRLRAWRYKTPVGEIDLVVTRGRTLVFVEVKMRPSIEAALSAIPPAAYRRLRAAATHFAARHPRFSGHNLRFDLIALAPPFTIRHLDNIDLGGA